MLRALELIGFKSFADKTRFEFPPGVTVVVGPNGSGKSNVVDAIKWVLGEQSAKSLRGREMADVIFNGSATRRPLNTAEITLTLDNDGRRLNIDTPEVHITRRVYRSGEGEYLINRQPCRLRDIRELFAGTGIATEAYSVIEQGKVDILLQSSPKERRLIFEEAAGISRFKAKKIEAQRRLERVEQNLLRLSDIVEEVESRLRSVRMQAAKARRYREYTQRLQELRTQVALVDWRRLTEQLRQIEAALTASRGESAERQAEVERLEAETLALETSLVSRDEALRRCDGEIGANRESIAAIETTIDHERARARELEGEAARHRSELLALSARAGNAAQHVGELQTEVAAAEATHRELSGKLSADEQALGESTVELDALRAAYEQRRRSQADDQRTAATLASEINALTARIEHAQGAHARATARLTELAAARDESSAAVDAFRELDSERTRVAEAAAQELAQSQTALARQRDALAAAQKELSQLQARHAAIRERVVVLEELEARLEGVSAGVRQVVAAARMAGDGPLRHVRGLVAEVLHVNVELAPLIDAALGEAAASLVVDTRPEFLDYLVTQTMPLEGRVGFVPLHPPTSSSHGLVDLTPKPGILGRADRCVQAEPEYSALATHLLGRTWIVDTLATALSLASSAGAEARFVTRAGEVVDTDGTMVIGPRQQTLGLVSRRSELRSLRQQLAALEARRKELEQQVQELDAAVVQLDRRVRELDAKQRQAAADLAEHRAAMTAAIERQTQLTRQIDAATLEQQAAAEDRDAATWSLVQAQTQTAEIDARLAAVETRLAADRRRLDELEVSRLSANQQATSLKVELARCEQRLDHLRAQLRQHEQHYEERHRTLAEHNDRLAESLRKFEESQRRILSAESRVAELYLHKESFARQRAALHAERDAEQARRAELAAQIQKLRGRLRKLQDQTHEQELVEADLNHQRTTLADRLREDYAIELADLQHTPTDQELSERAAVEQEIADLRRKLNMMGGVNLDALAELDDLEVRHESLSSQFSDLSAAKNALVSIIERINADSRKLFAETLETIRGHFQQLFRKLFGGGQADIVVEENADILDGGIEIVARPPGKEPRSISLLSGGEKTLTCVALLLSIFRSKPSPFCVLDEVDAALDEANIERFVGVIKEFLAWTQFIVVTHSKKTMTAADTLYGVTMQESGVSKRVAVRFDDVSETGEISRAAIERDASSSSESNNAANDDDTQAA